MEKKSLRHKYKREFYKLKRIGEPNPSTSLECDIEVAAIPTIRASNSGISNNIPKEVGSFIPTKGIGSPMVLEDIEMNIADYNSDNDEDIFGVDCRETGVLFSDPMNQTCMDFFDEEHNKEAFEDSDAEVSIVKCLQILKNSLFCCLARLTISN